MSNFKKSIGIMLLSTIGLSSAQEFKALYSCSSGGEEKPITYAFNSKYMLRDGASETPFEIVANFKDGELMYSGFVRGENFKTWDEVFGYTNNSMKKWSETFSNPLYVWDPVETKHEYILRKALNCTLDEKAKTSSHGNLNFNMLKKED